MSKIILIPVFLMFLFSGCSIIPDATNIKTYQLGAIKYNLKEEANGFCSNESLIIEEFTGTIGIYETKIFYSKYDGELLPYNNSFWVEPPFRGLKSSLVNKIINEDIFKNVNEKVALIEDRYILESKVIAFEHILRDKNSYVNFGIYFKLIDTNSKILFDKKIYLQKQTNTSDAKGAIAAFNEALEDANNKVSIWIKEIVCDKDLKINL